MRDREMGRERVARERDARNSHEQKDRKERESD
jgi:hypothetical protein